MSDKLVRTVTPPSSVEFPAAVWEELRRVTVAAYPYEGCGLLAGTFRPRKRVAKLYPLTNARKERGGGQFEFEFDAREVYRTTQTAEQEGLDIVGVYHSHPDHPARPSATDASQPMLARWSNVIAAVHQGRFVEARSWVREDEQSLFVEETIQFI
ncbi:MAG: M67 family metallopeptidase [Elusimicrobia bacterium]|nr:M67 family metallopeptidase [Elusimicrobiota bacterium]